MSELKSWLIKDTTQKERIELIRQWMPDEDGLETDGPDLWDMYDDYIKGVREIAEINATLVTEYEYETE